MTFEEAKALLSTLCREELVDESFGDAEVYWYAHANIEEDIEEDVAQGYFGRDEADVQVDGVTFVGKEARELRSCGKLIKRTRNDD